MTESLRRAAESNTTLQTTLFPYEKKTGRGRGGPETRVWGGTPSATVPALVSQLLTGLCSEGSVSHLDSETGRKRARCSE